MCAAPSAWLPDWPRAAGRAPCAPAARVRPAAASAAAAAPTAAQQASPAPAQPPASAPDAAPYEYSVVNFYHLVRIERPDLMAKVHKLFIRARGWDIRGRIYVSQQGINAQFSGPREEAQAYARWVAALPAFEGLQWRSYEVPQSVFPKLKCKPRNLIGSEGKLDDLPVFDETQRAKALDPPQWQRMLANARTINAAHARGESGRRIVVLDVRNGYEWDAGHFEGAERPAEEEFKESVGAAGAPSPRHLSRMADAPAHDACPPGVTHSAVPRGTAQGVPVREHSADAAAGAAHPPAATHVGQAAARAPDGDAAASDMLAALDGVSPDTPVMMYCTGGIRCDVYSTYLKQRGFEQLYSLKGGVQHYFDTVGGDYWNGSLYVFDERMAVAPGHMQGPVASSSDEDSAAAGTGAGAAEAPTRSLQAAQPCALCGGTAELPHLNCANVDCNVLFLACPHCRAQLRGCCSAQCRDHAPRLLRPVAANGKGYRRMSLYVDQEAHRAMRQPSAERLATLAARRERRRARLQAQRDRQVAEKAARKAEAKKAMEAAVAGRAAARGPGAGAQSYAVQQRAGERALL